MDGNGWLAREVLRREDLAEVLVHPQLEARGRWRRTGTPGGTTPALANDARAQPGNFATADSAGAYAAFAEKRSPTFTGRWALSAIRERNNEDA